MKRTVIVLLQSLLVASASIWVSQHATKAPAGDPDPAYFGRSGGPVGAELVTKLAKVQRKERSFDLVNVYGRGAPTLQQLTRHAGPAKPVYASVPAPTVK
jgi:hypothetical protein